MSGYQAVDSRDAEDGCAPNDVVHVYDGLAAIYDHLHPDRAADLSFYASLPGLEGATVLDAACGTGELTAVLDEHAARVVGTDIAPAMLARAARRLPHLRFVEADLRRLALGERFDLITCGFNAFQHFHRDADLLTVLRRLDRHLVPDGRLVFDIFNPAPEFRAERLDVPLRELRLPGREKAMLREDTRYDGQTRLLHIRWRLVGLESGEDLHRTDYTMAQIQPERMRAIISRSPLTIDRVFGDFDRSPFTPDSPRQIFVLKPAA